MKRISAIMSIYFSFEAFFHFLKDNPVIIDLHCHTRFSDGELTPEEVVLRADNRNINVLAITDHDTINGLDSAHQAIEKHNLKLTLIDGVEISTSWHGFEIHILGLKVNRLCPVFVARLNQQLETRHNRAERIAAKLEKFGFSGCLDAVKKIANGQCISRVHFAQYLVEKGAVSHIQKAFDKYLGRKEKAYVPPHWISIEDAVSWIKQAGGTAVLAHPSRYDLNNKWIKRLVDEFAAFGGDAIEVALPRQSKNETLQLAQYANSASLKASAGSDFHKLSPYTELGRYAPMPANVEPIWADWQEIQGYID